jgi:hypothetical protein
MGEYTWSGPRVSRVAAASDGQLNNYGVDYVQKVIDVVKQRCGEHYNDCPVNKCGPEKRHILQLLDEELALKIRSGNDWKDITESIMKMNNCYPAQTEGGDYLDHYLPKETYPETRKELERLTSRLGYSGGKSKKRVKITRKKGRIATARGIRKRVRRMRTKNIRRRRGNKSKRKI